jgi:hypothetical protein
VVRGSVLSGFSLLLSVSSHAVAGGSAHLSAGSVAGGLLVAAVSVAAADAQRRFRDIVAVVGLSQVALHVMAGGGHAGAGVAAAPEVGMVAAHVLAAVLVSAVLAHGERLIWSLFSLLRVPRAQRLFRCVRTVATAVPEPRFPEPPRLRPAFPRPGAGWRGPPSQAK